MSVWIQLSACPLTLNFPLNQKQIAIAIYPLLVTALPKYCLRQLCFVPAWTIFDQKKEHI